MPDTLTGYRVYTNLKIPAYAWKVRITLINLPLDNQQDISDLFLSFFTLLNFHRGDFPLSSLEEEKVQEKKYYRLPYEGEKTVHLPLPPPPPLAILSGFPGHSPIPFVFLEGERQEGGNARSIPMSAYGNTNKLEQKVRRHLVGKVLPTGIKPVLVVQEL